MVSLNASLDRISSLSDWAFGKDPLVPTDSPRIPPSPGGASIDFNELGLLGEDLLPMGDEMVPPEEALNELMRTDSSLSALEWATAGLPTNELKETLDDISRLTAPLDEPSLTNFSLRQATPEPANKRQRTKPPKKPSASPSNGPLFSSGPGPTFSPGMGPLPVPRPTFSPGSSPAGPSFTSPDQKSSALPSFSLPTAAKPHGVSLTSPCSSCGGTSSGSSGGTFGVPLHAAPDPELAKCARDLEGLLQTGKVDEERAKCLRWTVRILKYSEAQIDAMPLKDREHIRALRRGAKSKRQQGKALWAEQKLKREHEAAAPSASLAGSAGAIASAVAGAAASNVAAVNAVRAAAPPPIGAGAAAAAAAVARAVAPPPPVAPPESIDVEVPKGLESGQYFRVQAWGLILKVLVPPGLPANRKIRIQKPPQAVKATAAPSAAKAA